MTMKPARILIVTWYFPPSNTMGALRLGKLAKHLLEQGHDTRVLSARGVPRPQNLVLDFPEDRITRTNWLDVNRWAAAAAKFRRRFVRSERHGSVVDGTTDSYANPYHRRRWGTQEFAACLGSLYMDMTNIPDKYVGWVPYAWSAGKRTIARQEPDLILASGPPFSALIVGRMLADQIGVPWIAELRDRWSDDPYYPPVAWRGQILRSLERRLLCHASGLVTVSEPWAAAYRETLDKPTVAVYNGYDPKDFPAPGPGFLGSSTLRIVHTGRIYPGRRDPSPLFEAIALLDDVEAVQVSFVGAGKEIVMPLAARYGIERVVEGGPHLPYHEALEAQRNADILLLMQWNDPKEQGNVPGKLFEYLATRRPILGLGLQTGLPASIIQERAAGLFSNEPNAIAKQLSNWIVQKRTTGAVTALPKSVCSGFSRGEQFAKLEAFVADVLAGTTR